MTPALAWRLPEKSPQREVLCDSPLELHPVKDCSVAGRLQGAPLQHMPHVNRLHGESGWRRQHPNIWRHKELYSIIIVIIILFTHNTIISVQLKTEFGLFTRSY